MRAFEYFRRMFEIFFIFAAGIMDTSAFKSIESGKIPLQITMGKEE